MSESNLQPHKFYSRLNPHMLEYLAAEHLNSSQMKILLHLAHIMTRKNLAQSPKNINMLPHLSDSFSIELKNLKKLLKPMKELQIYISETPKAWRINPYILNKVEFLPSIYGFSAVSKLTEGYAVWALTDIGTAHVRCESYQALVKGQEVAENKRDDEMAELLKKMQAMDICHANDMSLVTEKLSSLENTVSLVYETLQRIVARYDDDEAKEVIRHLKIIK
jgi:hypothetical protein